MKATIYKGSVTGNVYAESENFYFDTIDSCFSRGVLKLFGMRLTSGYTHVNLTVREPKDFFFVKMTRVLNDGLEATYNVDGLSRNVQFCTEGLSRWFGRPPKHIYIHNVRREK